MPFHLLLRFRVESGVGAILSVSSGPTTTVIMRSVARRAQDAQTNTPPTTPTHLVVCASGSTSLERNDGNAPNEELTKCGRALYDRETDGLNVKLEEDSWNGRVVGNFLFIVRDAVLVRMQRFRAWCDVGCWDNSKEVLICNKICLMSGVGRFKK